MNLDKLSKQLLVTQRYCKEQMKNTEKNFASILRSINPSFDGEPLFKFEFSETPSLTVSYYWQYVQWTKDPYDTGNDGLIEKLFQTQLKYKELSLPKIDESNFEGEILAFHFEDTLWDGASSVSSYGLLDDYNCPPMDTWFYIQDKTLLAWIPKELVQYAAAGIAVNPEECIEWYKEVEYETYSKIVEQNKRTKPVSITGLPSWLGR